MSSAETGIGAPAPQLERVVAASLGQTVLPSAIDDAEPGVLRRLADQRLPGEVRSVVQPGGGEARLGGDSGDCQPLSNEKRPV